MSSAHLLSRPVSFGSGHLVRSSRASTFVSSSPTSKATAKRTTGATSGHFGHNQSRTHFVAVMALPPTSTSTGSITKYVGKAGRVDSINPREALTESPSRCSGSGSLNATSLSSSPNSTDEVRSASKASTEIASGFELSPVPKNPLGEGNCVRTAAAIVIGDEILNGKTMEKNSHYFAKYCFDHGIELKRVEVIPDEEQEIIEASRRMVRKYDLVITTGGIGPTHDDITYASLAKAFDQKLAHHSETLRRLDEMNRHRAWAASQNPQQRAATQRMALFPEKAEVLFVGRDIWVPVVRLEGKLCVFPGIPALFQKMLNGLTRFLPLPPAIERPLRIQVFTERPESMIAPYLTSLQARLKPHDIQVGSYPVLGKGVFVSLIGRDRPCTSSSSTSSSTSSSFTLGNERSNPASPSPLSTSTNSVRSSVPSKGNNRKGTPRVWLAEVACEVEKEIGGRIVSEEEVARKKEEACNMDIPGGVAPASGVQVQSQKVVLEEEEVSALDIQTNAGSSRISSLSQSFVSVKSRI